MSIGLEEGENVYLFGEITGTARISGGLIAVADRQAADIRFFDAQGTYVRSAGARGEGPGEFSHLAGLWRCGSGLYAFDPPRRRISEWTAEGELVREVEVVEPNSDRVPFRVSCAPDGAIIAAGWGDTRMLSGLAQSAYVPHEAPIWVLDTLAQPQLTLGTFQIAGRVFLYNPNTGGGSAGPYPLARATQVTADSSYVYVAPSEGLEVRVFRRDGTLARILRGPTGDLDIAASVLNRYVSGGLARQDSARIARMLASDLELPRHVPAVAALHVDPEGGIWVRRFTMPWDTVARWAVFAPEGRFLGHLSMPAAFTPHEFGSDDVLGITRDELGVERVQVFAINRPTDDR